MPETLVLASSAVLVLARDARPIRAWKVALIGCMAALFGLCMVVPFLRDYFELVDPPAGTVVMMAIVVAATAALLPVVWRLGSHVVSHGGRVVRRRTSGG